MLLLSGLDTVILQLQSMKCAYGVWSVRSAKHGQLVLNALRRFIAWSYILCRGSRLGWFSIVSDCILALAPLSEFMLLWPWTDHLCWLSALLVGARALFWDVHHKCLATPYHFTTRSGRLIRFPLLMMESFVTRVYVVVCRSIKTLNRESVIDCSLTLTASMCVLVRY